MKKPEVEVIKLSGHDVMLTNSIPCGANCASDGYCTGNCDPVTGTCTECQNDCIPLD